MEWLRLSGVALWVGWALDRWLGDPSRLPHPVVAFGKIISWGEHWLNVGEHRIWKGGIMSIFLVLIVYFSSFLLIRGAVYISPLLEFFLEVLFVFFCLAGTTLIREVKMTFEAADRSVEEGRRQVARIVGRDTSGLSLQEVRTAALETLAENLSDGVVAPLFWYMLLGVPGMLAYKMVNTLDSMIGYKNERYLLFGRVAARIDDFANYFPARLTAFLMIVVDGRLSLIKFVHIYGKKHASPNSGYPEAALAGILNCRFGGPHYYFGKEVWKPYIGHCDRLLAISDMQCAISINSRVEISMVAIAWLARLLLCSILYL